MLQEAFQRVIIPRTVESIVTLWYHPIIVNQGNALKTRQLRCNLKKSMQNLKKCLDLEALS